MIEVRSQTWLSSSSTSLLTTPTFCCSQSKSSWVWSSSGHLSTSRQCHWSWWWILRKIWNSKTSSWRIRDKIYRISWCPRWSIRGSASFNLQPWCSCSSTQWRSSWRWSFSWFTHLLMVFTAMGKCGICWCNTTIISRRKIRNFTVWTNTAMRWDTQSWKERGEKEMTNKIIQTTTRVEKKIGSTGNVTFNTMQRLMIIEHETKSFYII